MSGEKIKILFVGFSSSVHSARWISQVSQEGWNLFLFPSDSNHNCHSLLKNIKVKNQLVFIHRDYKGISNGIPIKSEKLLDWLNSRKTVPVIIRKGFKRLFFRGNISPEKRLAKLIDRIDPHIVHTLETQHAGYLYLEAIKHTKKNPVWIHSNWGSDIYLFQLFSHHLFYIRQVLEICDYYCAESERDVSLAKKYGFKGKIFPVVPNAGGLDLKNILKIKKRIGVKTSKRKYILLKGYQDWAGRALFGLVALKELKEILSDYTIVIYSSNEMLNFAAQIFEQKTKIKVIILPKQSHEEMIEWHCRARISIGLSISDGISTSFLEAIAMGSFPIQSNTSTANEWVKDGVTGLLVEPENAELIAQSIKRALTDDDLVDKAAQYNWVTVVDRLDYNKIKERVIETYNKIINVK